MFAHILGGLQLPVECMVIVPAWPQQCCVLALWLVLPDLALHGHLERRTAWLHSTFQAGHKLGTLRCSLESSPPTRLGAPSCPELRLKFEFVKAM
jgi:hypothetical protein